MLFRFFSKLLQAPQVPEIPMHLMPRAAVVRAKLPTLPEDAWLTKKMSEIGICSRSQAERMLAAGMVKVDGERVWLNTKVSDKNKIEIASRKDTNTALVPIPEETKLWLFYKPKDFTSTLKDSLKRPTVYHYLDSTKFPRIEVFTIGHIDFHSEGLMLLTNNEDLANSAEFSNSEIRRTYEIRVNSRSRVTPRLIEEIRRGMVCLNRKYRPMYVWSAHLASKSKNIWLNAILTRSHPRELRSIFERKKIHVNRLIRTKYGPYKLQGLKPGDFSETTIDISFHKLLFKYYKDKTSRQ